MDNNKNGYVGGFIGNQGKEENIGSYAGGIFTENNGVQENADSLAGGMALNNQGINGIGGFISDKQKAGTQGGYVGGYIGSEDNVGGYVGREENIRNKSNTKCRKKWFTS